MASGWGSLGEMLSGATGQAARDRGFQSGMQNRLLGARTEDALVQARLKRDEMEALEELKELPDDVLASSGVPPDLILRAKMGSNFSALQQGRLQAQEFGNRQTLGDVLASPAQKASAQFAVQGKFEPVQMLGSGNYLDIREPTIAPQETSLGTSMVTENVAQAALADARRTEPERFRAAGGTGNEPMLQVQQPDGSIVYMPRSQAAGMAPPPRASQRPTVDASNAAGFFDRMKNSEEIFTQLNYVPTAVEFAAAPKALTGGSIASMAATQLMSPQAQQYYQGVADWVRAKLRKESGAVIGENEMLAEIRTYFPLPGEGPEVRAQKARARQVAMQAIERTGASALKAAPAAPGAPGNQPPQDPGPGTTGDMQTQVPPDALVINTPAEARALPLGTVFYTPDGRRKVR